MLSFPHHAKQLKAACLPQRALTSWQHKRLTNLGIINSRHQDHSGKVCMVLGKPTQTTILAVLANTILSSADTGASWMYRECAIGAGQALQTVI